MFDAHCHGLQCLQSNVDLLWFLRKQILFVFSYKQLFYIDFKQVSNLQKIAEVWLRWIRTPLWNSWWGYAHLFWKPLTCALFFNKNDFYSIDIFHYNHFNFANIVNYFQFSLEYKNYLLLALLFLYFFMHLSEILLLSIIISYRKLTWPSPFFLFSPRLPFRCQESYSDSHYTRQLDFPAMSLIPHDIVLTCSLALVLSNDVLFMPFPLLYIFSQTLFLPISLRFDMVRFHWADIWLSRILLFVSVTELFLFRLLHLWLFGRSESHLLFPSQS